MGIEAGDMVVAKYSKARRHWIVLDGDTVHTAASGVARHGKKKVEKGGGGETGGKGEGDIDVVKDRREEADREREGGGQVWL